MDSEAGSLAKLTFAVGITTMENRGEFGTLRTLMSLKNLSLIVLLCLPAAAAAQTADEIVTKVLAARGGVERIKAVRSQRISGTINFGGGAQGPFLVELKRPGKMHIEVTIQGQTLVRSYDGKSAGWVINPFGEKKGVQPMSAEDISNIADESDFDGPLMDYKEKGNRVKLAGKEEVDGQLAYRLKLTSAKGETRSYLFDAGNFHLVRWEGTRKVGDKDVPWESMFRDYREVDGLLFAYEIDSDAPGTEQSQKIIADKIEVDPKIDESRFGKPVPPSTPQARGPEPPPETGPPPSSPPSPQN